MNSMWKRSFALLLSLVMVFGMIPVNTFAEEMEEHSHSYNATVTDPTCTDAGYTTYTCECGDSYTGDEVAATGHTYVEGVCGCGATEHTHSYASVVTDPTCTDAGYTTYTCDCGDSYTADEVAAAGHTYVEGVCACGAEMPAEEEPTEEETEEEITEEEPVVCDGSENCAAETHETTCECYDWCAALGCSWEVHHADCPWGPCTLTEGCELVKNHPGECTGAAVFAPVAKIGEDVYATFEEAVAAATSGDTIELLADVTLAEEIGIPGGVTLNGNGYQINGSIYADGNLTFAGETKVTSFSASYYDHVITIGEGASLEVTGTGRVSLAYGSVFNITGSVADAKNADKAAIKPSLVIPGGMSITGGTGATMNVTNAYIQIGNTSSKNSTANGTFNLNFNNAIAEFTNQLTFSEPTNDKNPTFKINVKDSVLTTVAKLCIAAPNTEVVIDNSKVTLGTYFRNSGNLTLKNGSELTGKTIQFGESGGNDGTTIVDGSDSKLSITGGSTGHAMDGRGTGKIILRNGAEVAVDYVKDLSIQIEGLGHFAATELVSGCTIAIDAATMPEGTEKAAVVTLLDKDALNALEVKNGKFVTKVVEDNTLKLSKAETFAKVGNETYLTLKDAVKAAEPGTTVVLTRDVTLSGQNAADFITGYTIDLNGKTLTLAGNSYLSDGTTTIKNGNIVVDGYASDSFLCCYTAGAKLVLDGVKLTGKSGYRTGCAVLNANVGEIEVKNSEINLSGDGVGGIFYGGKVLVSNTDITATNVLRGFTNSVVTISNGSAVSFTGGETGLNNSTVTIDGCEVTFTNVTKRAVRLNNNELNLVNGAVLTATGCAEDIVLYGESSKALVFVDPTSELNAVNNAPLAPAMIDGQAYDTLQAAFNAVENGQTITLVADVELVQGISYNKDITFTLDGAGHTIKPAEGCTATDSVMNLGMGSDATRASRNYTIKNVVFDGWKTGHVLRLQGVTATVENCIFKNSSQTGGLGLLTLTFTDATVSNCTFENNTCLKAIDINSWGDGSAAVTEISGCTFKKNTCSSVGVIYYHDGADLTLENCVFAENVVSDTAGNAAIAYMGWNSCTISGNTFTNNTVTSSNATSKRIAAAIFCDGSVVSNNAFVGNSATRSGVAMPTVAVGGFYNPANINANYWSDGSEPADGTDYTVEYGNKTVTLTNYYTDAALTNLATIASVAKVGETEYATLREAVAAAKDGDTVTLLSNVALSNALKVASGRTITLDLNGKTLTADISNSAKVFNITGEGEVSGTLTSADNTRINLYGGVYSYDVSEFLAYGYGLTDKDGKFEVTAVTAEEPKGDVEVTVGETVTDTTKKQIENNNAVEADEVKDSVADSMKPEDIEEVLDQLPDAGGATGVEITLQVKLVDETEKTETQNQVLVFDVTPHVQPIDDKGNEIGAGTTVTEVDKKIVFRLPMPDGTKGKVAIVTHKHGDAAVGSYFGAFQIQGDENNKNCYIILSSDQFSEFGVTITSDERVEAKVNETPYTTLKEAIEKAQAGDTVTLMDDFLITENWDCRYTGTKIAKAITIDGNGHTMKFTNTVIDNNHFTVFRFEAPVTVKNLTVDMSQCTNTGNMRAISTNADLVVEDCTFIGNTTSNSRAIIYGEGSGAAIGEVDVKVSGSKFINWKYGLIDNENGQNAKSVEVSDNNFDNAGVSISAGESITFDSNDVSGGKVVVASYSSGTPTDAVISNNTIADAYLQVYQNVDADVSENDLEEATVYASKGAFADLSDNYWGPEGPAEGQITASGGGTAEVITYYTDSDMSESVLGEDANIEVNGTYYATLAKAVAAINAEASATIKFHSDVAAAATVTIGDSKIINLDLNGNTYTGSILVNGAELTVKNGSVENTNSEVSAIGIAAGKLKLADLTIESTSNAVSVTGGNATIVSGTYTAAGDVVALNVTGGTLTLTGGTYDHYVQDYCAENYAPKNNANGTWTVGLAGASVTVGNKTTYYHNLFEAAAYANTVSGAVVTQINNKLDFYDGVTPVEIKGSMILSGLGKYKDLSVVLDGNNVAVVYPNGDITVKAKESSLGQNGIGTIKTAKTVKNSNGQTSVTNRTVFVLKDTELYINDNTTVDLEKSDFKGEYMLDSLMDTKGIGRISEGDVCVEMFTKDGVNLYNPSFAQGTKISLIFKHTAFLDTCTEIYLDNTRIFNGADDSTVANVKVTRGCTELELTADCVKSLSAGQHTVLFRHVINGVPYERTADFKITAVSSGTPDKTNPKTGDEIFVPMFVMFSSTAALAALLIGKKKRA